jgi:hypothetical protein
MTAQQPAITMAGRPWQPMRTARTATDEQLAQAVKRILWDAGTTKMTGRTRDTYLVGVVKNQLPGAVERFGELGILAAARRPEPPACSWCALRALTAAALEQPDPKPTPALRALLGSMCFRCEVRFKAQEVAEREQRLLAAGQRQQMAPTGAIWSAGKTLPPSYYRPGRPR